jgi:hypothetical protein
VVQPIGIVPTGKTLVILRLNKTNFIDSADAMCVRETGNLNLLCRGMMMSAVINNSQVIMELPLASNYSSSQTSSKK